MDFLSEVEKKLDLPPGEKAQVIRELKSHYEELRGEFAASGLTASQADQAAARKLGDPQDVASRLQAVHCRATWKTALLAAFPFAPMLIGAVLEMRVFGALPDLAGIRTYHVQRLILTAVFGAILIAGSVRELLRNRRPVWLATWLAVGSMDLLSVIGLVEWLAYYEKGPGDRLSVTEVFFILALGVTAVILYSRSIKWSLSLGVWTALAVVLELTVRSPLLHTGWFSVYLLLISAPLIMAAALGIFARHPYGNAAQASLFLFAFYVNLGLHATIRVAGNGSMNPMTPWVMLSLSLLRTMLLIGAVVAYARAGTWGRKLVILAGGILVLGLSSLLVTVWSPYGPGLNWSPFFMVHSGVQILFMLFWVTLVPLLFDRRRSERRPELVR